MKNGLPNAFDKQVTFDKQGLSYKTYIGLNELIFFLKEYYKEYEKLEVEVLPLSSIQGCGTDENGRAIIKGCTAFSVSYIRGINPQTGKMIAMEEWIEESNIAPKIEKVFDDYGLEINKIDFHNKLFLKNNEQISEQEASEYSTDDLRSEFIGATIVFKRKKLKDRIMSLVFKNKNKPQTKIN